MANNKIHEYLNEVSTPNDGDFLDLDNETSPTVWQSAKIKFSSLKAWILKVVTQPIIDLGTTSGVVTLDLATANHFTLTLSGNATITYSNPPSGSAGATYILTIYQSGAGGFTTGLDVAIKKPSYYVAPSTALGEINQLYFTWTGSELIVNSLTEIV